MTKNLSALKKAAEGTDNLMPPILEAVRNYASIGEICNTMRISFWRVQRTRCYLIYNV